MQILVSPIVIFNKLDFQILRYFLSENYSELKLDLGSVHFRLWHIEFLASTFLNSQVEKFRHSYRPSLVYLRIDGKRQLWNGKHLKI